MNIKKLWSLNNTIQCIMAANRVNENEFKVYLKSYLNLTNFDCMRTQGRKWKGQKRNGCQSKFKLHITFQQITNCVLACKGWGRACSQPNKLKLLERFIHWLSQEIHACLLFAIVRSWLQLISLADKLTMYRPCLGRGVHLFFLEPDQTRTQQLS
jgi:hypothetical protein